jgi:hypothetical protein
MRIAIDGCELLPDCMTGQNLKDKLKKRLKVLADTAAA